MSADAPPAPPRVGGKQPRRGGGGGGVRRRDQAQGRPRTASRVAAVQALFQSEQTGDTAETVIDQFVRHRLGRMPGQGGLEEGRVPDAQVPLFQRIVREAVRQQDRLDRSIAELLPVEWPIERLDPVLRAVLRAGGAELAMSDGPPVPVVINEYLDVAHGFFTGDEPRMVNGVLDRLAHVLRGGGDAAQEHPAATAG